MPADPERRQPGRDFGYTRYDIPDALGAPAEATIGVPIREWGKKR